jgi:hypothetical protein
MMDATGTARVKEGGREVSNGVRLLRRAIWAMLAVGACLPASAAAARPAVLTGRGLTTVSLAALSGQRTTRDVDQKDRQASGNKRDSKKPAADKGPKPPRVSKTPKAPVEVTPLDAPAPAETEIFKNIKLSIVIAGEYDDPPRRIKVTLWTRERNEPATPQDLGNPAREKGAYVINLPKGLHRKKDYWVTVSSADGRLSGEAAVDKPPTHNDELPVRVNLYPAVDFDVFARREGTFSVVEKSQEPSSSIPHALEPGGKTSFVKGLKPGAEYVLVTDNGGRFVVSRDEIKDSTIRMDLSVPPPPETFIKVSTATGGRPVRDAVVNVIFDESLHNPQMTNEQGVAVFAADARKVRAVEVEAQGHERFYCGRDDEACPEPDASGTLAVTLTKTSWGEWVGSVLRPAATIIFVLVAAVFIVLGFAVFRILLNPTTPPPPPSHVPTARTPHAAAFPKRTSGAKTSVGVETSSQPDGTEAQEPGAAFVQQETLLTSNAEAAAQSNQPPAVAAYSVPNALSVEMAKEAYKRWVRREKLTRDPLRLDIVLSDNADDQNRQFRETNDPGSKFILFPDGENGGWLFPNPAPSVFQTEVEQTWRLVFKDLSKEEFGRKRERLNPLKARRADGVEGKAMWAAEPKPYEFG